MMMKCTLTMKMLSYTAISVRMTSAVQTHSLAATVMTGFTVTEVTIILKEMAEKTLFLVTAIRIS